MRTFYSVGKCKLKEPVCGSQDRHGNMNLNASQQNCKSFVFKITVYCELGQLPVYHSTQNNIPLERNIILTVVENLSSYVLCTEVYSMFFVAESFVTNMEYLYMIKPWLRFQLKEGFPGHTLFQQVRASLQFC